MPKVLIVHGMNMHRHDATTLREAWQYELAAALRRLQAEPAPRGREREPVPMLRPEDIDLVFWADLFQGSASTPRSPAARTSAASFVRQLGGSLSRIPTPRDTPRAATIVRIPSERPYAMPGDARLREALYSSVRREVLRLDRHTHHDPFGRPTSRGARWIDHWVRQTALYMAAAGDGPHAENRYFAEVQARMRAKLAERPTVVIGHSLGSVIAYEGLCAAHDHGVEAFITLGSPMALPHLIMEKLRARRLAAGDASARARRLRAPHGVRCWTNVTMSSDAYVVPVPSLGQDFERVQDILVDSPERSLMDPMATHRFSSYVQHGGVLRQLSRALSRVLGAETSDDRAGTHAPTDTQEAPAPTLRVA